MLTQNSSLEIQNSKRMISLKRIAVLVAIIAVALLAASTPAFAQCAMCKAALAGSDNPAEAAKTMNTAILVLFVPTIALICAIIGFVLRYRHSQGGEMSREVPELELPRQPQMIRDEEISSRRGSSEAPGELPAGAT